MSTTTEKVFCLVTDGDYPILKFVFNDILKKIFQDNINDTLKIMKLIKSKVNENTDMLQRIEEKGIKLIQEKIYDNYLIFNNLQKNKIKFFVLYIGDINQSFYEQNLFYNIYSNNKLSKDQKIINVINSLKNKYNLTEIKTMIKNLKIIISSFNDNINTITEKKFIGMGLDSIINTIINNLKLDKFKEFNFQKLESEIKLDLVFDSFCKNQQSLNDKYQNLKEKFKFINLIKVITFRDSGSFLTSFINDSANSIEPKTFNIYITDDINVYTNIMSMKTSVKIMKQEESYNIRYIFFNLKDGKYNIDFEKSDFQKIFDITFLNINKPIMEQSKNFKKNIKYSNIKDKINEILTKDNLIEKLKDEFNKLNINADNLYERVNNYNYEPDDNQYFNLISSFKNAFKLIGKDTKLMTEKMNILHEKINKLIENIICKRIYNYIEYKIMLYINQKVYQELKKKLLLLIDSLGNIHI